MRNYLLVATGLAMLANVSCILRQKIVDEGMVEADIASVRGTVRCAQNSPDGEANLRTAPSRAAKVVDVLRGTLRLTKVGEEAGSGCDSPWAVLQHASGNVYACGALLKCGLDSTPEVAAVPLTSATEASGWCMASEPDGEANMRSAPTIYNSRVLSVLTEKIGVTILGMLPSGGGCSKGWWKVKKNALEVYVCGSVALCEKNGASGGTALPPAPVLPSPVVAKGVTPVSTVGRNVVVSADGTVELNVPYLCQYQTAGGGRACQVTSFSMAHRYLTGSKMSPDSLFGSYTSYKTPDGMADRARRLGLKNSYGVTSGSEDDIKRELRAGNPVVVFGCYTSSGHVILIVGYNKTGWIVNDPAGKWAGYSYRNPAVGCGAMPNDGAASTSAYPAHCNGSKVVYPYSMFRRASSDWNSTRNYWFTVLAK